MQYQTTKLLIAIATSKFIIILHFCKMERIQQNSFLNQLCTILFDCFPTTNSINIDWIP